MDDVSPADRRPAWFASFLADRGTRKPSPHTMKAYGQDFDGIAAVIAGDPGAVARMPLSDISTESMRVAFAQYAETHSAASILRCWSTWNVLCTYLFTSELITANPMPQVGRPRAPKSLPKSLPDNGVVSLLSALSAEPEQRRGDWVERDRAIILTALLTGLRADELLRANIGDIRPIEDGDIRPIEDGAVLQVTGKGGKDRRIPVEAPLVAVLTQYLDGRAARFPATGKKRSPTGGLGAWAASAPLFVGVDGDRITRGTLQYRVLRASTTTNSGARRHIRYRLFYKVSGMAREKCKPPGGVG